VTTIRRGRQSPDGPLEASPGVVSGRLPDCAGEFLHAMLNVRLGNADAVSGQRGSTQPAPEPGPPWTHTIVPPPVVCTRSGKVLYRPPARPWFTLTRGDG
jgi:hypothetical protein